MTKSEKLHKLANAIKDYRGSHDGSIKPKWIRAPQPHAEARVRRWLGELNLNAEDELPLIRAFASKEVFLTWLSGI